MELRKAFEIGLDRYRDLGGVGETPQHWYKMNLHRMGPQPRTVAQFPSQRESRVVVLGGGPSRSAARDLPGSYVLFTRRNLADGGLDPFLDHFLVDVEVDPCWPIIHGYWEGHAVRNMNACVIEQQSILWARCPLGSEAERLPHLDEIVKCRMDRAWDDEDSLNFRRSGEAALELAIRLKPLLIDTWGIEGGADGECREAVKYLRLLAKSEAIDLGMYGWVD